MKINQWPLLVVAAIGITGLQGNAQRMEAKLVGRNTDFILHQLSAQGVGPESIFGFDANGVPIVCGTSDSKATETVRAHFQNSFLPPGTRGWECVPGVIRFDGKESFRLEVNVNGLVNLVSFKCPPNLIPAVGGMQQTLRDDGLGGDLMAGDFVFTSVSMVANTNWGMAAFLENDTNSPAGMEFVEMGAVKIVETNGETNDFLIFPQVGMLNPNVPARAGVVLSSNVVVSDHLINIRSGEQRTQKYLRQIDGNIQPLLLEIYAVVPDLFHFLMFFSTDHVEARPMTASVNFYAGLHSSVQVNYTGTGSDPFDSSSYFGSKGRLLSLNFLDTNRRGAYSANATHEILHQWLVLTAPALGLDDGTLHYTFRSSAASLLGGYQWNANGSNVYLLNCDEGRSGAYFAPPLDKYMMGLIEGTNVPPILFYSSSLPPAGAFCGTNVVLDHSVTVGQIQAIHGIRTPRPASAQKEFFIGFIAETHNRLFNATERTFYDILAQHYTKPLPVGSPTPYVGYSWVSIDRFFGEGTIWRSDVIPLVQPRITSIGRIPYGIVQLEVRGAPDTTYMLQSATNFVNWSDLYPITTTSDGSFQALDYSLTPQKFYRLRWP